MHPTTRDPHALAHPPAALEPDHQQDHQTDHPPQHQGADPADDSNTLLEGLLANSSRTFALSIPLLPPPLRRQVTVAYLLFRIADTFEDEPAWDTPTKLAGLEAVDAALAGSDRAGLLRGMAGLLEGVELSLPGYTALMRRSGAVIEAFDSLPILARLAIAAHLRRTIAGMADQLRRTQPISTVQDVRQYCYYVAGIVGEMLTDLFMLHNPSLAADAELIALSPRFGEALQLVNILRDAAADASEGRFYLPSSSQRPALFDLAFEDLRLSGRYVQRLEHLGADPGVVAFNALNLRLANATIALVREHGPGAKLTRDAVRAIFDDIQDALRRGQSVSPLAASG